MLIQTPERKCRECGAEMAIRGYTNVEKIGKVTVSDGTAVRPACPNGHVADFAFDEVLVFERRAVLTVLHDGRHVDGAVMKYARKTLGLKQAELASLLDVTAETVSRWENDHEPTQRATQLAVAAIVDHTLQHGLIPKPPEASEDGHSPNGTHLEVQTSVRRTG
jgi:DNA-binding XRE family transcriptional regulator